MNRRNFFSKTLVFGMTCVASLNIPHSVFAQPYTRNILNNSLAGNIFYTENNPGRWKKKMKGHLPTFELINDNIIEVTTGHEMNGFEHYIIKHSIFDENMQIINETMFNPEKDAPISKHDISNNKNVIFALSLCNKHDAWLNAFEI